MRNTLADLWMEIRHPYKSGFNEEELTLEKRNLFLDECAKSNRVPALVIMFMTLVMECFMVFCYLIQPYVAKQASFFPQYIYLYLSMIFISVFLIILLHLSRDSSSKLKKLEFFMLIALGIWSAIFSACDVINGFSSYLFIQIMIINSLIIRVRTIKHCVINFISYFVYMIIILSYDLGITITFAELINPFLMMVAACIVIILNNRIKFRSYINQELIKEQNKKLEYYANNDFLTKIPNRKNIIDFLNEILLTHENNISCLMIDIDDFKLYNDTYGHLAGDNCLVNVASIINEFIAEKGGRVGRYGGEEFLIVFKNKEEKIIVDIANQLIDKIREENIEFTSNDYKLLTISIGVHTISNSENVDLNMILSFADEALYQAKKEGKNKISLYRH